jgi:hypothetical protein
MSTKNLQTILSLLEICETNLKNAKMMLAQMSNVSPTPRLSPNAEFSIKSQEEINAAEVVEGYFDGESMIGDNGQLYPVPQNYASKSQLCVGDRMKWILTKNAFGEVHEVYKLTQPVPRDRAVGKFLVDGNNYCVMLPNFPVPVKILKASATYAMKNMHLKVGDEVAIYIPKGVTPVWGAFISVVNNPTTASLREDGRRIISNEVEDNFVIDTSTDSEYF